MTNYTVLIANGEFPNNEYCNDILSNNPEIICVDTDQKLIEKLDIQPKIILGDLDTAKTVSYTHLTLPTIIRV